MQFHLPRLKWTQFSNLWNFWECNTNSHFPHLYIKHQPACCNNVKNALHNKRTESWRNSFPFYSSVPQEHSLSKSVIKHAHNRLIQAFHSGLILTFYLLYFLQTFKDRRFPPCSYSYQRKMAAAPTDLSHHLHNSSTLYKPWGQVPISYNNSRTVYYGEFL